jgi:membrane protein
MAAALAFHALFGLFPVLLVATIVVKAIQGTDAFLRQVGALLDAAGLDQVRIIPPLNDAAATRESSLTLSEWLEGLVRQAANVNLTAVGWLGLALIIYAAIGLVVTIENSFNTICRAPEGRPWTRRVPLYWFILTVSPVAIGLMVYANDRFDSWFASLETWHGLAVAAGILWSFIFGWLFMFALYTLVPNATISLRPALAGALVAALLLEVGKRTMGAYLENVFSISQLYGSLGLVPLFMFWLYLMWLVVLFGLEVSATLQMLRGRELDDIASKRQPAGVVEPASVLMVMEVVAEGFNAARATTVPRIAATTLLPESVVRLMVERLIEAGLLHRLRGEEEAVSLAGPPEQITADQLIEIGFELVNDGRVGRISGLTEPLRHAQRVLAAKTTLATLVSTQPATAGKQQVGGD